MDTGTLMHKVSNIDKVVSDIMNYVAEIPSSDISINGRDEE